MTYGGTDEERRAKQREATRRYRQRHPERARATARALREADPERAREYTRAYYQRHRDRLVQEEREWRAANPDKVHARNHRPGAAEKRRVSSARWRSENPELARTRGAEAESRRRARMRGAGEVEVIDRDYIIARDKQRCHLCGKRVARGDIQLDHLIPLSRGGPHTSANLAVAHRKCNAKKWANPANDQLRLIG